MRIALATLCLNEMEWLPKLYEQHKNWPDLVSWIFVESADQVYASTNPTMVRNGLSVDGTSQFLENLHVCDNRIKYIPHGLGKHTNPSQGKCESRNRYLEALESIEPDLLFILDADEFYTYKDQQGINTIVEKNLETHTGFCFPYRNIWRPPIIEHLPLFSKEVVGGFWGMPHCHGWKWYPGLRYTGYHMTPEYKGNPLSSNILYMNGVDVPACVHMAYASDLTIRQAKHRYYENRGESTDPRRRWYTMCRRAFEYWKPGDKLLKGAKVIEYTGPIPEVFQENSLSKALS